jgi:hypothetical protein
MTAMASPATSWRATRSCVCMRRRRPSTTASCTSPKRRLGLPNTPRDDGLPEGQARRPSRLDSSVPGLVENAHGELGDIRGHPEKGKPASHRRLVGRHRRDVSGGCRVFDPCWLDQARRLKLRRHSSTPPDAVSQVPKLCEPLSDLRSARQAGPRVRIRLPPAGSQVRTRPHGFGDLPPASHAPAPVQTLLRIVTCAPAGGGGPASALRTLASGNVPSAPRLPATRPERRSKVRRSRLRSDWLAKAARFPRWA